MKTKRKNRPRFTRKRVWITFGAVSLIIAFVCVYIIFRSIAATTITHNFSISPAGSGTIKNTTSTLGAYVNCPSDCTQTYNYNATYPITYRAYPAVWNKFLGWERVPSVRAGIDYTTNPFSISRKTNWTFVAKFARMTDQEIINVMIPRYTSSCPILGNVTVEFGDAKGYEAISFYSSGRIIVSPTHKVAIERLLLHELYHIYDYKDNGVINWGESVPPTPQLACMSAVKF